MVSIRGPRSALTDFIEKQGIKIVKRGDVKDTEPAKVLPKKRLARKRMRQKQPLELINLDKHNLSLEEISLQKIMTFFHFDLVMDDVQLESFSAFLSRNRMMNALYFRYLVAQSTNALVVYDCSMVEEADFLLEKPYRRIELHFCGQLTATRLDTILRHSPELEILKIKGGFLIENFTVPRTVRILDVSYCSRLRDAFIEDISATFKSLEELNVSYCHGLSETCALGVDVQRLCIDETNVSDAFFLGMQGLLEIQELSLSMCPKIHFNDFSEFERMVALNVRGMDAADLRVPLCCKRLNLESCMNITKLPDVPDIESLSISRTNLSREEIEKVARFTRLKELNLGWSSAVDDDLMRELMVNTHIEKIYVFGCFRLTPKLGCLAWDVRDRLKIIGNPAETSFLLNNM